MSNEFDSITPHVRCEICGVNCLVISNEIKYDCGQVFALCTDCKLAVKAAKEQQEYLTKNNKLYVSRTY